jgi:hypothetical protein
MTSSRQRGAGIVASDKFQRRFLDLETFYLGNSLHQAYEPEKFKQLCERIECDHGPILNSFWGYRPPNLETEMNEIAAVADDTPSLVLRHPLAQRVLTLIEKLGSITETLNIGVPYYRARRYDGLESRDPSEFLPRPASHVTEGRYNHHGHPVLYLGSDDVTCYREVGEPCSGVCISTVAITRDMKVLNLCDVGRRMTHEEQDLLESVAASSLMAAPVRDEGWHRPEYVFTRFVADCARLAGFWGDKVPQLAVARMDTTW